jgi:type VI secretion system protein ImpK
MTDAQVVAHIDAWLAAPERFDVESMRLLHAALSLAPDREDTASSARSMGDARGRLARGLQPPSASRTASLAAVATPSTRRLRDVAPVWVLAAVGSVAMMLLFVALRISINADSDPVFASLRAVDVSAADLPASSPALSPAVAAALVPRLATFLKQDIDAGLVLVDDLPDKSVVTIRSDIFFEPGSAVIADPVRMFPLMGRIAAGLNAVPGHALVAGHTDTRHDHSVLYPSNWHLSQDRANVVTSMLAESVDPQRLLAQGRADSEPVGDNATAQGRSDNRRVDITLVVSQPS